MAVVYFSATGTTRKVAEALANHLGVTAQEIVPAAAYTAEDLDYNTEGTRATAEARDASARPELASAPAIPAGCDTVYLGYPIWWGDAASPLRTYVEQANLSGKTVIPFCTSGGSDIPTSVATLSSLAPDATWKAGRRFLAGASDDDIASWADSQ